VSKVEAPWSAEVVRGLNDYQRSGRFHPYSCPRRGDGKHRTTTVDLGALVATTDGWMCPDCDYRQLWAHAWTAVSKPG